MKPNFWFPFICFFALASPLLAEDWSVYEECAFLEDSYFDGDSFYLKASTGYTYIFRLYGVDSLETDDRYPDRIKEQAIYFGIPEKRVLYWGEKAAKFTEKFLKRGRNIVAVTKKEKAGTQSAKNRYFAIIEVDDERLDEALIEAGLARAYGMPAAYPRRLSKDDFQTRLRRLESKAKRDKVGIWGESD